MNPFPVIILVVLLAVLVGIAGRVLLSTHAVERHGTDAHMTRDCIERNGPSQVWMRSDDPNIEYWLCQIPDGRWCVQINQVWNSIVDNADYRERSAFCPANGAYQKVVKYLEKFATRAN